MSILGFRAAIDLWTLVDQAIAAPRRTGQPGLFRVLHTGEAEVTIWPAHGADEHGAECEHWSGPIVRDNDKVIVLNIDGTEHTWLKSDRITVKYGDVVVA